MGSVAKQNNTFLASVTALPWDLPWEPGNSTEKCTSGIPVFGVFPLILCSFTLSFHLCGLQMWIQRGRGFWIYTLKIPVGFFSNGSLHAAMKVLAFVL